MFRSLKNDLFAAIRAGLREWHIRRTQTRLRTRFNDNTFPF